MLGDRAPWFGKAFGLELTGHFVAPGIVGPQYVGGRSRPATLRRVARFPLEALFDLPTETLVDRRFAHTRLVVRRHPDLGFLFEHGFYGRFRVGAEGSTIDCAPRDLPDPVWQRFLVGQLLPLASVLQGLETLHASVVAIDGVAVLLIGTGGTGKTSVALQLAAQGATFLADDVAVLEAAGDQVQVHPGAPVVSVDATEVERLPPSARARWQPVGSIDGETRLALRTARWQSAPVARVFILTRRRDVRGVSVTVGAAHWPAALLGATFNAYLQDAERLKRQLGVCSLLSRTAILRQVVAPMESSSDALASAIRDSSVNDL